MLQVKMHGPRPDPFISVHAVDIGGFLVLLAIGIAMRKNSAVALADPGFNRFIGYVYPANPHTPLLTFLYIFYGNILIVALMLGWDFYRGRLIRSHIIASISLLTCMYVASVMYCWKPWQNLTLQW
jgi:hypothetical protein